MAPDDGGIPINRAAAAPRSRWVDSAKAISILLIVTWHTLDQHWPINAWLGVVRVPLFFFTSGLFAVKALHWDWARFLRDRVGHLLYLYVLWVLIFVGVGWIETSLTGQPAPFAMLAGMFTTPLRTLWFIYVLAITFVLARIARPLPPLLLGCVLVALYCWSVAGGDWRDIPLADRIVRAAPFFLAGTLAFKAVDARIGRYDRWWAVLLTAYVPVQLFASRHLFTIGPVMLLVPAMGVTALLLLASWTQRTPLAGPLNYLGARTIQVYLLHRVVVSVVGPVLAALSIRPPCSAVIDWVCAVAISLALGAVIEARAPWLFEAPWLIRSRRPARPGPAAVGLPRPVEG